MKCAVLSLLNLKLVGLIWDPDLGELSASGVALAGVGIHSLVIFAPLLSLEFSNYYKNL